MLRRLKPYRKHVIVALTAALGVLAVSNVYHELVVNPMSNDECLWMTKESADSVVVVFEQVKPDGAAGEAGIENGDVFVAFEGAPVEDPFKTQELFNAMAAGDTATFTVLRDGELVNADVRVEKLINIGNLSFSLLAFFWLAVGFVVIMAKPGGREQRFFYAVGAALVVYSSASTFLIPYQYVSDVPLFVLLWYILWLPISAFGGALAAHFFLLFPRRSKLADKKWALGALYGVIAAMVLWQFLVSFDVISSEAGGFHRQLSGNLVFYLYGVVFLLAYVFMLKAFFTTKDKRKRKPLVSIIGSLTLILLGLIFVNVLLATANVHFYNNPELFLPFLLLLLLPLSFGYSIFRYQMLDVSTVFRDALVYGAGTVGIAAVYLFTVFALGLGFGKAIGTEYRQFFSLLAFVGFALLFQSTKDRLQTALTKRFYPEQFLQQRVLTSFASDVNNLVGERTILDSIVSTFVERLRVRRFGVALARAGRFESATVVGAEERVELAVSPEALKRAADEKRLVVKRAPLERSDFAKALPEDADKLERAEIYTLAPMIVKDRVVGAFFVGLKRSGSQFGGKDLETLGAVAAQAAAALENARLYEQEAEKRVIEADLALARQIQDALLPSETPETNGFDVFGKTTPAMRVGGDYFDAIQAGDDKLYVVVADVAGKGVAASLYMAKFQTMARLFCDGERSPRDVLVEINRRFDNRDARRHFITASVALFDATKGEVVVARAGHMPTLRFRNGAATAMQSKGAAIGLTGGAIFDDALEEERRSYAPGEAYLLFSDGVNETTNPRGEFFGVERIVDTLRGETNATAREIFHKLAARVSEFQNGAEQNDDFTAVVVKIGAE